MADILVVMATERLGISAGELYALMLCVKGHFGNDLTVEGNSAVDFTTKHSASMKCSQEDSRISTTHTSDSESDHSDSDIDIVGESTYVHHYSNST
ncbi:unnamed protein product [Leptosia nina]|uniref:Uncharacterized protein n=1 Tax=Leptosia nina TaxID=320188 RepID=A0AAV1JDC2_9NEOP